MDNLNHRGFISLVKGGAHKAGVSSPAQQIAAPAPSCCPACICPAPAGSRPAELAQKKSYLFRISLCDYEWSFQTWDKMIWHRKWYLDVKTLIFQRPTYLCFLKTLLCKSCTIIFLSCVIYFWDSHPGSPGGGGRGAGAVMADTKRSILQLNNNKWMEMEDQQLPATATPHNAAPPPRFSRYKNISSISWPM